MYRATWHGAILAESDHTVEIERNQYFPPDSLNREYFQDSELTSTCPWKGTASYYTVTVDGKRNHDAAWYYPHPKPAAAKIRGYVAFWKGVRITAVQDGDTEPESRSGGILSRLIKRAH